MLAGVEHIECWSAEVLCEMCSVVAHDDRVTVSCADIFMGRQCSLGCSELKADHRDMVQ